MPRQSKEKAEATRLSILDAAELVFDAKGVSGATLEGIAAAAGLTRGAIYWHFDDKQSLLKALLKRRIAPLIEQFKDGLRASSQPDVAALVLQTDSVLRQLLSDPASLRVCRIMLLKCEYLSDAHPVKHEQERLSIAITSALESYFKRLKLRQGKDWPDVSPAIAAKSYQCYIFGLIMQYLKLPGLINLDRQLSLYLRSFFPFTLPQSPRRRSVP